jgi:hypothetical protein
MKGSSSDDWILLAVWLQPLVITLNHNAIAITHILQSLHILIHTVYFQQSSLQNFHYELIFTTDCNAYTMAHISLPISTSQVLTSQIPTTTD